MHFFWSSRVHFENSLYKKIQIRIEDAAYVLTDGQARGEGREHPEGGQGDAEHIGEGEAHEDGGGDGDGGDQRGLVAEGQAWELVT